MRTTTSTWWATATDDFTVSVDGGPAVQYNNFGTATINALAGDDDISLDVNGLNATVFMLNGEEPSSVGGVVGDTVTVTGVPNAVDNPVYRPTGAGSGSLEIGGLTGVGVGGKAVQLQGVERLIYDGENSADNLTVVLPAGAANQASFEYDAFASVGTIEVKNVDASGSLQPLLGIQFQNVALDDDGRAR